MFTISCLEKYIYTSISGIVSATFVLLYIKYFNVSFIHIHENLLLSNFKELATTNRIGYYLYLFMQTQFLLDSYIHAYTNETHSLASLQD